MNPKGIKDTLLSGRYKQNMGIRVAVFNFFSQGNSIQLRNINIKKIDIMRSNVIQAVEQFLCGGEGVWLSLKILLAKK